MRGSGEAGSGSNLCEGLTACRGAAVGVSARAAVFQPPSALAPLLLAPSPARLFAPDVWRGASSEPRGGGCAAASRGRSRREKPGGRARGARPWISG